MEPAMKHIASVHQTIDRRDRMRHSFRPRMIEANDDGIGFVGQTESRTDFAFVMRTGPVDE